MPLRRTASRAVVVTQAMALIVVLAVAVTPAAAATNATDPVAAPSAAPVLPTPAGVGEIESLGSPTQTVTRNANGTTTVKVTSTKSRYKDPSGVWRDIDLTLVPQADGSLGAKASDGSLPRIANTSAGSAGSVSAPTPAGTITLAHPGATPAIIPRLAGPAAVFPKAVAGRDLQVQLRPDGFEESLLLATPAALAVPGGAGAAGSYTETFTLPAGVTARPAPTGVEFVNDTGTVIATYGGGSANDSKIDPRSGDPASSPVTTTLVGQVGAVATVHVAVDAAWLAEPARVFPVSVDPTFTATTSSEASSYDTYTYSPYPTTPEGSKDPNILKVGSFDGGASRARTYLMFNLSGFQNTNDSVQSAQLSLFNNYSYGCSSGGQSVYAQGAGAPTFSRGGTTWNNQPNGDGVSPNIGSGAFAYGYNSSCGANWVRWDISAQAQRWANGAANQGLVITSSNETNSYGWRKFASGTSGGTAPSLVITYGSSNCTYYPQTGHSVCGAIRDKYNALGGPSSYLGYPTSDETGSPDGIGRYNSFQNAGDSIYWTPATGAHEIGGAIFGRWGASGYETGLLGYPITDELGTPDGVGRYNHFFKNSSYAGGVNVTANGSIYFTGATGAHEVHGPIRTKWASLGYETSCLAYPTSDVQNTSTGQQSTFQGGTITYDNASGQTTSSCGAPPPAAPSAPTNVKATAGNASAMVSWTASATNGSPVTNYTVTSNPGNVMATTPDGNTTTATVGGLTNGTAYTFTVVANSAAGASPASAPSNSVTPVPAGGGGPPPTSTYPGSSTSRYVASTDTNSTMDGFGCADAQNQAAGKGGPQYGISVLDFGAQTTAPGTAPPISGGSLTDQQVQALTLAYAGGLARCGGKNYIVALGTNNSGSALNNNPTGLGMDWAALTVSASNALTSAETAAGISIQGASDIEPGAGFDAPGVSLTWAQSYAANSGGHVYYNYGSADGCPLPTGNDNPQCTATWHEGDVWATAGSVYNTSGTQISLPFPEIYASGQSSDWIAVATWGSRNDHSRHANFVGAFADQGSASSSKSPQDAWQTLYTDLNASSDDPGVIQKSLPYATNDFTDK